MHGKPRRLQDVFELQGLCKLTANEPWGEDCLAQRCMDLHGVDNLQAFHINTAASSRHGALGAIIKTGNGVLVVRQRRRPQSITSNNPMSTSTASTFRPIPCAYGRASVLFVVFIFDATLPPLVQLRPMPANADVKPTRGSCSVHAFPLCRASV